MFFKLFAIENEGLKPAQKLSQPIYWYENDTLPCQTGVIRKWIH